MTATTRPDTPFDQPAIPLTMPDYLAEHTLSSWLLTKDHKRIGILFLAALTFFFVVGAIAAGIIRLELFTPQADVVTDDGYNKLFTMHGIIMVWFFLVPVIPTTLGNFFVPIMIGAHEVAFPRINLMSWYIQMIAGLFVLYVILTGGVDTGWTFYVPYSVQYSNTKIGIATFAIFIVGFSSIATGINMLATIHTMRAPGMTWFRLPLFVWSIYATALLMVLATPVLAITLLILTCERAFGIKIFDPATGGDPLLFQHMFWFYSHPAVYIMIVPGMGVVSEIITCFARRPIFGYRFMVYAMVGIAVLSFFVWGHHMFVSGQSAYATLVFSFLSFMVAVPSAIKVFNWSATLFRGQITFEAPMLYALGFVGLFTIGGLTGLMLASVPIDVHVTDTYFVVAHFHYIMVGGMVSAFFGGIHFWWPKITGRLYHEGLARFAAMLMFAGFNLTFFPQYVMGYLGMPRRYHTYLPEFQVYHVLSSAGAVVLGIAYIMPLCYLLWSYFRGEQSGPNPWNATGLEWQTTSPPPEKNFDGIPKVTREPYDYHPEAPKI